MKADLLKTTAPPTDLLGLSQIPRELTELVEPGQEIPGHRRIYHEIGLGKLPMIQHRQGPLVLPAPRTAGARHGAGPAPETLRPPALRLPPLRRFRRLIPQPHPAPHMRRPPPVWQRGPGAQSTGVAGMPSATPTYDIKNPMTSGSYGSSACILDAA